MAKSMYLINPRPDFSNPYSFEIFEKNGFTPVVQAFDLSITTVAAMLPKNIEASLCDEAVMSIDFETKADVIGITGKGTQSRRMVEIATIFRNKGKKVMMGGPFVSLNPDKMRPYCDTLVIGEIENIYKELFHDLECDQLKNEYTGDRPLSIEPPVPILLDYPTDRTLCGNIQTSRSCPFDCDFCDVITFLGKGQRHKPISIVIQELDNLFRLGYRSNTFADDNITANRRKAKELFLQIRDWNQRTSNGIVSFSAQLSIDTADDNELLKLMSQAGVQYAFVGIETPNETSLSSSGKRQNLSRTVSERVDCVVENGIALSSGIMVGFDSDKLDIFDRQFEFSMSLPIPIYTTRAVVAPYNTPLYKRLFSEGRIDDNGTEFCELITETNIKPLILTKSQLRNGIKELINKLFDPICFEKRIEHFMEHFMMSDCAKDLDWKKYAKVKLRAVEFDANKLVMEKFKTLGQSESELFDRMKKKYINANNISVRAKGMIIGFFLQYMQHRYLYDVQNIWDYKMH